MKIKTNEIKLTLGEVKDLVTSTKKGIEIMNKKGFRFEKSTYYSEGDCVQVHFEGVENDLLMAGMNSLWISIPAKTVIMATIGRYDEEATVSLNTTIHGRFASRKELITALYNKNIEEASNMLLLDVQDINLIDEDWGVAVYIRTASTKLVLKIEMEDMLEAIIPNQKGHKFYVHEAELFFNAK